jgi:catechol 2,3-dioxygenase-like lactoylglutathione lyase family enzyme
MASKTQRTSRVLSPKSLAHVVLRTNKYDKMVQFYEDFLGSHVVYKNEQIAFLAYDEEHHRLALVAMPGIKDKDQAPKTTGLEHIAFTYESLADLLKAYQQRKELGIKPVWSVNHGPSTSIYYKDPDGNMLETQVDSLPPAEATRFMHSKSFAENPIGSNFDPEDFIRRLAAGESAESLQKRKEIGRRGVPGVPKPKL